MRMRHSKLAMFAIYILLLIIDLKALKKNIGFAKTFFFSGGKVTLIIFKCVVFKVRFLSLFFLNLYLPLRAPVCLRVSGRQNGRKLKITNILSQKVWVWIFPFTVLVNLFSELSCQAFVGPHHSPVFRLTRNVNVLNPVCEGKEGLNVILTLCFWMLQLVCKVSAALQIQTVPSENTQPSVVIDWKCEEITELIQQSVFAPNCSILEEKKTKPGWSEGGWASSESLVFVSV